MWVNSRTQLHCTVLCYRHSSPLVVLSCGGGGGGGDNESDRDLLL